MTFTVPENESPLTTAISKKCSPKETGIGTFSNKRRPYASVGSMCHIFPRLGYKLISISRKDKDMSCGYRMTNIVGIKNL